MTLVVNLFGGPGVSKSTTAALVFGKLKVRGVNAELAAEFAKDLTWEERWNALSFQPYVAAKQMFRVHRLLGKVDVIVTDSPVLVSLIYKGAGYTPAFEAFLIETFRGWETLNILLGRNTTAHPYSPKGRSQSESESIAIDGQMEAMLDHLAIPHLRIPVVDGEGTADEIVANVLAYRSLA